MKSYVAGFMFRPMQDPELGMEVALVRKIKGGEFQVGRLNGIGGKIEKQDAYLPELAMLREFEEETGCKTKAEDWRKFCRLHGQNRLNGERWEVFFFVCLSGEGRELQTMEEESIE